MSTVTIEVVCSDCGKLGFIPTTIKLVPEVLKDRYENPNF